MHIEKGHVNKTSTTLSEKHVETDPGIECCDFYNIDESCFPNCKQHDIPLDRIEESSRDMTCEDWLPIIKSCRDGEEKTIVYLIFFVAGTSGWKLDKCCGYDVSKRCRPIVCRGDCKDKPWEIIGNLTGDEECDKYAEDVSSCCNNLN